MLCWTQRTLDFLRRHRSHAFELVFRRTGSGGVTGIASTCGGSADPVIATVSCRRISKPKKCVGAMDGTCQSKIQVRKRCESANYTSDLPERRSAAESMAPIYSAARSTSERRNRSTVNSLAFFNCGVMSAAPVLKKKEQTAP